MTLTARLPPNGYPAQPVFLIDPATGQAYAAGGSTGSGGGMADLLFTDDSGALFVRQDSGTAITWKDIDGNTVAKPGTGLRLADGIAALLDKTAYQATTAATGYSVGDLIDKFVIVNPTTGVVLGTFWLNVTTGAKLASAPSSANIKVTAGGSFSAQANAAAQALTEGAALDHASVDLYGAIRMLQMGPNGLPMDNTAPSAVTQSGPWDIRRIQDVGNQPAGGVGQNWNSFTRPANTTLYTIGDIVGPTSGWVKINPENRGAYTNVLLNKFELTIALAAVPSGMSGFRVHFYGLQPASTGDNNPFVLPASGADYTNYEGYIDLPTPEVIGSILYTHFEPTAHQMFLDANSGGSFWINIVTKGGYTPTSAEAYRVRAKTSGF